MKLRCNAMKSSNGGTITITANGTISLAAGQFTLAKDITIAGPGADQLTIDAHSGSRLFTVNAGVTAELSGLTLTNGSGAIAGNRLGDAPHTPRDPSADPAPPLVALPAPPPPLPAPPCRG